MATTAKPKMSFSIGRGEDEVKLTIWENEYKEGKFSRSYSITRSYKDENGEWKKTSSFKIEHLPSIAVLLQRAIDSAIQVQKIQPSAESSGSDSTAAGNDNDDSGSGIGF